MRRNFLLDTARSILVTDGFSGITFDRVARDSGVSRALIYKHFAGLNSLIAALVDRETAVALDGLHEVLTSTTVVEDSAEATADAMLFAVIDATGRAPLCWSMLLDPPRDGPPELYERIAVGRAMARSGVEHLLQARLGSSADVELTARLLHLALEELLRLHLADPASYPRERIADQARRSVAAALLSDPTRKEQT